MSSFEFKTEFEKLDTFFTDKETKKLASSFVKQVAKYWDYEKKHLEKLKHYAENKELIDVLLDKIKNIEYPLYERSLAQRFTFAIFAMSNHQEAHAYLEEFTDIAIENYSSSDIAWMHTNIINTSNKMDTPLLEKITHYREQAYISTGLDKFLESVGVESTKKEDVYFSFSITNFENIEYEFQLDNPDDKQKFASLSVQVFYPKSEKDCFEINLNKSNIYLSHMHKEPIMSKHEGIEIVINKGEKKYFLEEANNISKLKETIKEIENITGTKFYKNFVSTYFPRGVKGKASLQKWFLKE